MWVFDRDRGRAWWANVRALALFAAPDLEALQARQRRDEMSDGMRRRLASYWEHFERGDSVTEEWTFYPEGAEPVVAECACTGVRIEDDLGERLAMLVEARPRERSAIGDNERRLVEALRHCGELISFYRLDGHLLLRNPAAEQTLGLAGAGAAGADDFAASFADEAESEAARGAVREGEVFRREVRVHTRGGSAWHDTEVRGVVDPVSGQPAVLAVQHDVTAHRESEQRVRAAQQEAELLRDEAQAASRAKSAFLGVMSHELRTPMTGALAAAEVLRQSELSVDQRELLEMVLEGGRQMVGLIDDILDITRVEAGRVDLVPRTVSPRALVSDTLRPLQTQAQRKALQFSHEVEEAVPDFVRLDRQRVAQVLANLAGNAIKFTDTGRVQVVVSSTSGNLRFEVRDTGVGMATTEHIFEAFSQAAASGRGGAGLGLHIAQLLTRAMGGELGVETAPGVGSTFWFSLPLTVAEEAPEERSAPARREHLGLRVFVVDDNALNRRAFVRLLRQWGCETTEAEDGVHALAVLDAAAPDVILMDVNMPRMDGPTAAREIRARSADSICAPIIALTADTHLDDDTRAVFDDVLFKPVDWDALYQTLRRR